MKEYSSNFANKLETSISKDVIENTKYEISSELGMTLGCHSNFNRGSKKIVKDNLVEKVKSSKKYKKES